MTALQLIQAVEAVGGVLTLSGDRIQYELPEDAAPLVEVLREHREEVLRVLLERRRPMSCCVHGAKASWWTHADSSRVCGRCHPDPYVVALQKPDQGGRPPTPGGVTLLEYAPKHPPIAIETWAIVNDIPQFIRTTLAQLESALQGDVWERGTGLSVTWWSDWNTWV